MDEPSGGRVLRVGVEAIVRKNLLRGEGQFVIVGPTFADQVSGESPMAHRGDHVLADAEPRDRFIVGKHRFLDPVGFRFLIEDLFEPHLPQCKGLVAGEVWDVSLRNGCNRHARILALDDLSSQPPELLDEFTSLGMPDAAPNDCFVSCHTAFSNSTTD